MLRYLQDPPDVRVYREIKPNPDSKHQLSVFESRRLESHLEQFHKQLAHFGNTSMNKELADALSMRGTTEHNILVRHKNNLKKATTPCGLPGYLRDVPAFLDFSMLHYINSLCLKKGMRKMFEDIQPLKEDNGETFLSVYLHQQRERSALLNYCRNASNQCNCGSCLQNCFPLIGTLPSTTCDCGYSPFSIRDKAAFPTADTTVRNVTPQKQDETTAEHPPESTTNPATAPTNMQILQTSHQSIETLTYIQPRYTGFAMPLHYRDPIYRNPYIMNGQHYCHHPTKGLYCDKYKMYINLKNQGKVRQGRPPHDIDCPSHQRTQLMNRSYI